MKNIANLGFVLLLFVVLGCNCQQKLQELIDQSKSPSPTPSVSNTSSSPASSPAANKNKLTLDVFNQLKNGMSYKEVVGIVGFEGVESSTRTAGKTKIVTYKWQGVGYEYIFANFTNDKMSFKTQANLK